MSSQTHTLSIRRTTVATIRTGVRAGTILSAHSMG